MSRHLGVPPLKGGHNNNKKLPLQLRVTFPVEGKANENPAEHSITSTFKDSEDESEDEDEEEDGEGTNQEEASIKVESEGEL